MGLLSISAMIGLKALSGQIAFPFVLNLSLSMPSGVYRISPVSELQRGMLVLFRLPRGVREPLAERAWLKDMPLLKPVAALPGDAVCVNRRVTVNGQEFGEVSVSDSSGKPLSSVKGCYTVSRDMFLPLSTHSKRSFDGRYFGEIRQYLILGQARPVVTW